MCALKGEPDSDSRWLALLLAILVVAGCGEPRLDAKGAQRRILSYVCHLDSAATLWTREGGQCDTLRWAADNDHPCVCRSWLDEGFALLLRSEYESDARVTREPSDTLALARFQLSDTGWVMSPSRTMDGLRERVSWVNARFAQRLGTLSKRDVKEIIARDRGFPINVRTGFRVGHRYWLYERRDLTAAETNRILGQLARLEDVGLVAYTLHERDWAVWRGAVVSVSLTEAGKQYQLDDLVVTSRTGAAWQGHLNVKIREQHLNDVTAIKIEPGRNEAIVVYTWHYSNLTPFGEALGYGRDTMLYTEHVQFVLGDEGWRVQ